MIDNAVISIATLFVTSCSSQSTLQAQRYVEGRYTYLVEANATVISLLSPADIKIIFYVEANQLHGIKQSDAIALHPGQPVTVSYQVL